MSDERSGAAPPPPGFAPPPPPPPPGWTGSPPPPPPHLGAPPVGWVPAGEPHRDPAWLLPTHVSKWAVAAGYLGLVTFILLTVPGPFALYAGIRGRRDIRRDPTLRGEVRSWVGIVLGGLGTIVLVLLIAAFGIDAL